MALTPSWITGVQALGSRLLPARQHTQLPAPIYCSSQDTWKPECGLHPSECTFCSQKRSDRIRMLIVFNCTWPKGSTHPPLAFFCSPWSAVPNKARASPTAYFSPVNSSVLEVATYSFVQGEKVQQEGLCPEKTSSFALTTIRQEKKKKPRKCYKPMELRGYTIMVIGN